MEYLFQNKICTKCGKAKHKNFFPLNKSGKQGINPSCKECKKTERYNSPGKGVGRNLLRYWPDCSSEQALQNYFSLQERQNNVCAICKNPEILVDYRTKSIRRLAVDHDHKTGKIRGLLCHHCNTAIGKFKDNVDYLIKAIEYIIKE